jgi:beta-glucosidase
MGCWNAQGDASKVSTILDALKKKFPNSTIEFCRGADFVGNDRSGFEEAKKIVLKSDIAICAIGENIGQSGETASRSDLGLPGVQQDLLAELVKLGRPIVAMVMAGRPLTIEWLSNNVSAIIFSGQLGTRAGEAIADILSGDYNPSGKLVMCFPRNTGQIPIFYNHKNTGRPFDAKDTYTTRYLDITNDPLYPFGYGLSYTTFEYSDLKLNKTSLNTNDTLKITFSLKNTGNFEGEETAQLYIRDLVGCVTRPVKELRGFKKVLLKPGELKELHFSISNNDLKFYDSKMNFVAEPGQFKAFVGGSSEDLIEGNFELLN